MRRTNKLIAAALCAGLSLTLAGCSDGANSNGSQDNTSAGSDPIKLAVYPLTSPYFEYAIEELRLFDKYNANVELVEFAQYTDVIQALNTGNVDASIMGITEAIAPIANDVGLEIVYMTDYSAGMDGIVVSSDITDLSMLEGEIIATNIGTMNHMLLLSALESVGLSEDDVTITNMSEGDAAAALIGGSIKAASIFDPQMTRAAEESGGNIIFTSADIPGELSDVLLVNEKITSTRAEEVMGIINAWVDIQEQYTQDSSEIVEIISNKSGLTTDDFYALMAGLDIASPEYNKQLVANDKQGMTELVLGVAQFLYDADCVEAIPTEEQIKAAINTEFIDRL